MDTQGQHISGQVQPEETVSVEQRTSENWNEIL